MLRFLMLCLPMLLVPAPVGREPPSRGRVARLDAARAGMAARIAGAVQTRFMLAASAADCRFADNRYGYELLVKQLPAAQRAAARAAAEDGRRRGAALLAGGTTVACPATLSRLEAADDALVVLSEHVGEGEEPGR